jgi:DNA invertase Pin-like site-specific DNA recombinase
LPENYQLETEQITMANLIAYVRVSTQRQAESGLGLDGQRAAVQEHAVRCGSKIVATYTETESGTLSDRPQLAAALAHAKRSRATLVVAKLDRLARNVAFLAALMDSGVEFVACDNPHANRLTLHILSAMAEHEARMISERTKVALKAAKARGVRLGSNRPGHWTAERAERRLAGLSKARQRSALVRRTTAVEVYADLAPSMLKMQSDGHSLRTIAAKLNADGHCTRNGRPWSPQQVRLILKRFA